MEVPTPTQEEPSAPATATTAARGGSGRRRSASRGGPAEAEADLAGSLTSAGGGGGGPTVHASGVLALLPEAPVHVAAAEGMLVGCGIWFGLCVFYMEGGGVYLKHIKCTTPDRFTPPPKKNNSPQIYIYTTHNLTSKQGPDPEALLKAQARYLKRVLLVDWLVAWLAALLKGTREQGGGKAYGVCVYICVAN